MAENFNDNYSRYYDMLYKDKNYKAESDYIISLIRSVSPNAKNIIELGCGTGNHANFLCKNGFKVLGLERSLEMVELAKAKSIEGFTPVVADIEKYNVAEKFDVALSLFHVVSYLTSNKSLISCFKSTAEHLNHGGVFIFDVWYTPAVYYQHPETRIKRMEDDSISVTRFAEPEFHYNKNVVDVNYEIMIRDKNTQHTEVYAEKHPMRHFSLPEMDLLASLTGFKVIKTEAFGDSKDAGNDTWGICFILQKNNNE